MMFTTIVLGAAVVSGLLAAWSLQRLIMHRIREYKAGRAIHARLRPDSAFSQIKEPLLPLSVEAARLPETGEMMNSYWKSGLYGLVFLASAGVFAISALMSWAILIG